MIVKWGILHEEYCYSLYFKYILMINKFWSSLAAWGLQDSEHNELRVHIGVVPLGARYCSSGSLPSVKHSSSPQPALRQRNAESCSVNITHSSGRSRNGFVWFETVLFLLLLISFPFSSLSVGRHSVSNTHQRRADETHTHRNTQHPWGMADD